MKADVAGLSDKQDASRNWVFWATIVTLFFAKLFAYTALRFMYTFSTEFAAGVGVDLGCYGLVLALPELMAMLWSPLAGTMVERLRPLRALQLGLCVVALGTAIPAAAPSFSLLAVFRGVCGAGFAIVFVAVQGFLGEFVPEEFIGRVTGFVESGWALSALVGIPCTGLVLSAAAWRWTFFAVGMLFVPLVVVLELLRRYQCTYAAQSRRRHNTERVPLRNALQEIASNPESVAVLFICCTALCIGLVFTNYGRWLLDPPFNLSVKQLGGSTCAIGGAELIAPVLVLLFADKVGFPRAIAVFNIVALCALLALALSDTGPLLLPGALIILFSVQIGLDFCVVATMGYASQVMRPEISNIFLGLYFCGQQTGFTVAAAVADQLWQAGQMTATGGVAASVCVFGFWLFNLPHLLLWIRTDPHDVDLVKHLEGDTRTQDGPDMERGKSVFPGLAIESKHSGQTQKCSLASTLAST